MQFLGCLSHLRAERFSITQRKNSVMRQTCPCVSSWPHYLAEQARGGGDAQERQAPVCVGGSGSAPQNKSGVLCRLAPPWKLICRKSKFLLRVRPRTMRGAGPPLSISPGFIASNMNTSVGCVETSGPSQSNTVQESSLKV